MIFNFFMNYLYDINFQSSGNFYKIHNRYNNFNHLSTVDHIWPNVYVNFIYLLLPKRLYILIPLNI
jgi:hypothetical protein